MDKYLLDLAKSIVTLQNEAVVNQILEDFICAYEPGMSVPAFNQSLWTIEITGDGEG